MKRGIGALALLILTLAVFLSANAPSEAQKEPVYGAKDVYRNAEKAVFYIRNLTKEGTLRSVGTGFVLTEGGQAATAYHVVKEAASLEITLSDGTLIKGASVVAYDEFMDTALLKLPKPPSGRPYSAIAWREASVAHGERVFAIGYPLKATPIMTEGIVSSPKAEINSRDRILISADIASGMSGGPVLDEYGEAIGLISGSLRTMQGIHLVVGNKQFKELGTK